MNITANHPQPTWLNGSQPRSSTSSPESSSTGEMGEDPVATKQMFLQLLVSQIKNQNPLNPADPSEFVAQLSQFTGVEQMLGMRQELEAIHDLLAGVEPETK